MKARVTFRKQRRRLHGIVTYEATQNGLSVATIQEKDGRGQSDRWFWYAQKGPHVNTADRPDTLEGCKEEIKNHFENAIFA